MNTARIYLRQFAALVTDLRHRFTNDLFFRTTMYVVGVQMAIVIVLITIFGVSLRYANEEVVQTTISHVVKILENNQDVTPQDLVNRIGDIQTTLTILVFIGIVALAVVSGITLSYLTLGPARAALENQKLFISNVAHELRTPLSTIKTSTEVLMLSEHLSADTRDTLKEIVEELDRASEIINNLLSLNSLLRPERMEFSNIDLGTIVDTAVKHLAELAEGRNIAIAVKKSEYRMVWGNTSALEQVMTNIVRNSISYMAHDRKGHINVTIEPDYRGCIALSIEDNGIGIAQQDLFHIFEPFYRADLSRSRGTQVQNRGSGLGLAIVNDIVRLHHGRIRMKSALGKGTTTTILLPTGPEVPSVAEERVEREDGVNEISADFSKNKEGPHYFDQSPTKKNYS